MLWIKLKKIIFFIINTKIFILVKLLVINKIIKTFCILTNNLDKVRYQN